MSRSGSRSGSLLSRMFGAHKQPSIQDRLNELGSRRGMSESCNMKLWEQYIFKVCRIENLDINDLPQTEDLPSIIRGNHKILHRTDTEVSSGDNKVSADTNQHHRFETLAEYVYDTYKKEIEGIDTDTGYDTECED